MYYGMERVKKFVIDMFSTVFNVDGQYADRVDFMQHVSLTYIPKQGQPISPTLNV